MRKIIFFLTLCGSTTILNAQYRVQTNDSLSYYQQELWKINKDHRDSFYHKPLAMELNQKLRRLRAASDNYKGFSIYTSFSSVNFGKFNSDNALSNFSPFSGQMLSFGYGFSFKKNKRIFDFNVGAFGVGKRVKKGNESIITSFSTLLQLEWGFDFIRSNTINIYPYVGVGLRSPSITYNAVISTNPSYSNVTNIVQTNNSIDESTTELGYQAGVGFEFVLTNRSVSGGTLVFIKAGTNRPFSNKAFNIAGVNYDPNFKFGEWTISVGFKFFGR